MNGDYVTHFDSFGVEHIPKEINNSEEIKMLQQIFIEYKQMNQ